MTKVLRLQLYQQTACYKKPFAFKVSETYPLPPYSTVKGMLHALLKANSFIPMKISIQGKYDTLVTDYQTHYFYKKDKMTELAITMDGLGIQQKQENITTMPMYTHMLHDVNLIIHIQADKEVLEQLYQKIQSLSSHLSLGRWEDLVQIEQCQLVEIKECKDEPVLAYNAYVPQSMLGEMTYFPYQLNWTYRIVNGVRAWNRIKVGYVEAGSPIDEFDNVLIDEYGDCVLFPNEMEKDIV